jgi:hypothetical protein
VIAAWPTGYDVERYAEEHGLDFDDITRAHHPQAVRNDHVRPAKRAAIPARSAI